jgi:hypothetical protein
MQNNFQCDTHRTENNRTQYAIDRSLNEILTFSQNKRELSDQIDAFWCFFRRWTGNNPIYRYARPEIISSIAEHESYPFIAQALCSNYQPELMGILLAKQDWPIKH